MSTPPGKLAPARKARGWSQAALAAQSGISRSEVSGIEIGRLVPSVTVAMRLAAALDLPVETLFGSAAPPVSLEWAWNAPRADPRAWRAQVGSRVRLYPVELTAAGAIAHDALADQGGLRVVDDRQRPDRTLVVAGCDPLVALLTQAMAAEHDIRVLPLARSSTDALELLRAGLVHVAGIHLSDHHGRSRNDQAVVARLGAGFCLMHQVQWELGIAIGTGRRERTARALIRANVRWVNREEGSAARHALDLLMTGTARRPAGYRHVVRDHRAVAATVASGWADAGICIRPVADEAGVGFIPLQRESYELCVPAALIDDPRVAALSATLRSLRYRRVLADVPTCSSAMTGEVRVVSQAAPRSTDGPMATP